MQSLSDKERLELLGEVFMDELRAIREYLSDIPLIKKDLGELRKVVDEHTAILQAHDYEFRLVRQELGEHTKDIAWMKQKLA